MAFTMPTIAATTATVDQGITYGIWAVQQVTFWQPPDTDSPADPNGPHAPLQLMIIFIKGRIHPDGYFQSCPVVPPVTYQLPDLMATAQGSATLQDLINRVVTFLNNQGKAKGIL